MILNVCSQIGVQMFQLSVVKVDVVFNISTAFKPALKVSATFQKQQVISLGCVYQSLNM